MLIAAASWVAVGTLLALVALGSGGAAGVVVANRTHQHERDQIIRDRMLAASSSMAKLLQRVIGLMGRLDNEGDPSLWTDVGRRRGLVRELEDLIGEGYSEAVEIRILFHPDSDTAHHLRRSLVWSNEALVAINAMYERRSFIPDVKGDTPLDADIRAQNRADEEAWRARYARSLTRVTRATTAFETAIWQAWEKPRRPWPSRSHAIIIAVGHGPQADLNADLPPEDRVDLPR